MRKCQRCQIIYHSAQRHNCLYCDAPLIATGAGDGVSVRTEHLRQVEKNLLAETKTIQQMQYALSSYFRVRSFAFTYAFCRNQMKFGKIFGRFFIEPLNFGSLIKLPWLVVNAIDSFLFRLVYQGFCSTCQWKHKKLSGEGDHPSEECAYNQEYSTVLSQLLSGDIVQSEDKLEEEAVQKHKRGQHSAYHDLCRPRRKEELWMDIGTLLISFPIVTLPFVWFGYRILGKFYEF